MVLRSQVFSLRKAEKELSDAATNMGRARQSLMSFSTSDSMEQVWGCKIRSVPLVHTTLRPALSAGAEAIHITVGPALSAGAEAIHITVRPAPSAGAEAIHITVRPALSARAEAIHITVRPALSAGAEAIHITYQINVLGRLEAKIKATRKEVSQLSELLKGVGKKGIPRKYNKLSIPEALETAKQRFTGLATCLKRYTRKAETRRIKRMFSTKPSKAYSLWQGNSIRIDPPWAETEQYWKSIREKEASHNTDAKWLVDLRADHSNLPDQESLTITMADIQERVLGMKSWTTLGPDMIHTYWLKKVTALYWPVTCLCTTWKLLSGIIAAKMNRHMAQKMSKVQKGIGSNTRGAEHQLLVHRAVTQYCKTRQTNLCTAWIDYKKAYDSMPHTWILECLEMYNINRTLRAFINNSMGLRKTTLEANSKPVTITCGIY
ncbi:uncharacterized protein LOC144459905 [Epinephelus lanceolatus]